MGKRRESIRQLRLPLVSYYVTVVDGVEGSRVSVVDRDTWQDMMLQHRDRIERVEHKAFGSGLVANLVLRGEDGARRV